MHHRKTTRWSALCVLSVACAAGFVLAPSAKVAVAAGATANAAPDLSTPKKAAVAFATALAAGDLEGMKASSIGTDEDYKTLMASSETVRAMTRFRTTAIKKYGDPAKEMPEMSATISKDIESAEEKVEGDTATLLHKDRPGDKHPATLKKVGGQWKMDLKSISGDPQFANIKETAAKATKAIDGVTADVEAGKYATFKDAYGALQKAMEKLASQR